MKKLPVSEPPFMEIAQAAFEEVLAEQWQIAGLERLTPEEMESKINEFLLEFRKRLAEQTHKNIKRTAPAMLRKEWRTRLGFEKRCFQRWRPALEIHQMIISVVAEVGEAHRAEGALKAQSEKDWKFAAQSELLGKGLLVAREIHALLLSGFPDGALSRWRTLHELTVTACFLRAHDSETSLRYLASFNFERLRSARQFNRHAGANGRKPLPEHQLKAMEAECNALAAQLAMHLDEDYAWAAPALGVKRPNFASLEKAVGMDHWRPMFRWACGHIHAGHRDGAALLGLSEASIPWILTGQSNSGFVDPLSMSAMSLSLLFSAVILGSPNLDRLVMVDAVGRLAKELGEIALATERETLDATRAASEDLPSTEGKQATHGDAPI